MRAVNLIPSEARRGGPGGPGRSGGAVYVLLGVLAAIVVGAGVYVLAGNTVTERKAELARVTREAASARAQANTLHTYTEFAALRRARAQTVASLADSRFDWARTLRQVARVLPKDVWLTSLDGSVSPDASAGDSGGGDTSLRSALPNPAIEMIGCTVSQAEVSRVMARLRLIDGVQRVSLDASEKNETPSSSAASGGSSDNTDCRYDSTKYPQFQIVIFLEMLPTAEPPAPSTGSTGPATAASTTAPVAQPPASGSGQ